MDWIKRNMMLVVSGAVALILIAAASYYVFSRLQAEKAKDASIAEQKARLETLYGQNPYPQEENTEAALKAQENLKALLKQVGHFYPLEDNPDPTNAITNARFKYNLIDVVAHLNDLARKSSIVLPTNFNFSFTRQSQLMQLATNGLDVLQSQLLDVKELSEIVFKAQIPELLMLRRAPVTKDDQESLATNPKDYLGNRPLQTNDWCVRYPYEVTIKGLTDELRKILEGLAYSSRGFVVRNVKVELFNAATEATDESGGATPTDRYGLAARYGRYGRMMPPAAVAPPPPKPTTGTVVDKQPLKITLMMETLRPLPEGARAPAAPADPTADPAAADPNAAAAVPAEEQPAN